MRLRSVLILALFVAGPGWAQSTPLQGAPLVTYYGTDPTVREPCRVPSDFVDTDATSTAQRMSCVAGVFVTQGGAGGSSTLDGLTDTVITAPATGQTLVKSASDWVNGPLDLADGDARTGILPLAHGGTGADTSTYGTGLHCLIAGTPTDCDNWIELALTLGITNTAIDATGNATFLTLTLGGGNLVIDANGLITVGSSGGIAFAAGASPQSIDLKESIAGGGQTLHDFLATGDTLGASDVTRARSAGGRMGVDYLHATTTGRFLGRSTAGAGAVEELSGGAAHTIIEAAVGNIVLETEFDASAELRALMDDEVGTGALMFGLSSSMADDISCGALELLRRNAGDAAWECAAGGGSGAPTTVDYLVGTADGTLVGEIVVGTAPGGELGGTWASPTIDDGISVNFANGSIATADLALDLLIWPYGTDLLYVNDASVNPYVSYAGGNVRFDADEDADADWQVLSGGALQALTTTPIQSSGAVLVVNDQLGLLAAAAPTPTVEGAVQWEDDDDHIIGGDGATQVEFVPAEDMSGDATQADTGAVTIAAAISRDTEWDTAAEINAATTDVDLSIAGAHEECFPLLAPSGVLASYDVGTVWRAPIALTITEVFCETDTGTVDFDFQIDDGTPADVMGTDLVCDASGETDNTSITGSMAVGDRLDFAITSVATTPTRLTACVVYTR